MTALADFALALLLGVGWMAVLTWEMRLISQKRPNVAGLSAGLTAVVSVTVVRRVALECEPWPVAGYALGCSLGTWLILRFGR